MRPIGELRCQVVPFRVRADFPPSGDQSVAISELERHIRSGEEDVVLLDTTGMGKTTTVAWLVERLQRPVLMIRPNKTLTVQFANELCQFSPDNTVEYFVSYYDCYQPEAYAPQTDTYAEKDSSLNEEVEHLQHSAMSLLLTRRDCIMVATVSAIYGLGAPQEYLDQRLTLRIGEECERSTSLRYLVDIQYNRSNLSLERGNFWVRGGVLEIFPMYEENVVRIEFFGDEIECISTLVPLAGEVLREEDETYTLPAIHYSAGPGRMERAVTGIEAELTVQLQDLEAQGELLETQQLRMRTNYDIEMMYQIGTCSEVENYSRHIDGRAAGSASTRLLGCFPEDFFLVVGESHVMVPQVGGMYESDTSWRRTLVEHGFRLSSALGNQSLEFDKFCQRIGQTVYLSATPGPYELGHSDGFVEQIIWPTGLVDLEIIFEPTKDRIDDLIGETRTRAEHNEWVLMTTLTRRMVEDLTDYLMAAGIWIRYLHPDINTLKRAESLRELRLGNYDVLMGINLLREGLDLSEVSLVIILDTDKEDFLRSECSLIQAVGRATHDVAGQVYMYADTVIPSMAVAVGETNWRRARQLAYNTEYDIDPQPLRKRIINITGTLDREDADTESLLSGRRERGLRVGELPEQELVKLIGDLTAQIHQATADLQLELAAYHHDEVADLKKEPRQMIKVNK